MTTTTPDVAHAMPAAPRRPRRPAPRWGLYIGIAVVVALTMWAAVGIDFTLAPLFTDATRGAEIISRFFDPNWSFAWRVSDAWLQTLEIAVIASAVGCSIALVLAMFSSDVTASKPVYRTFKVLLAIQRSLPDIAWVLMFAAVVGAGPLAGILALVMFNIGVAAKLTAESIDAADRGPVEAADAVGAGAVQRARVSVLPQVLPNFVSYSFYVFELNIRASLVIGLGGGGGIGEVLRVQLASFQYENIAAIIVVLVVVVFALDQVSRALRRRLI